MADAVDRARLAAQRREKREVRVPRRVLQKLVAPDQVLAAAGGIDQRRRDFGRGGGAVAQHRHQRHQAGTAGYPQQRPAILGAPNEMAADRAADLDLVADLHHLVEEGRHLAVVDQVDRQLDRAAAVRRRADRIAALGLVAIRRGQSHVDMLAGGEAVPVRRLQPEQFYAGRLGRDGDDGGDLPDQPFRLRRDDGGGIHEAVNLR